MSLSAVLAGIAAAATIVTALVSITRAIYRLVRGVEQILGALAQAALDARRDIELIKGELWGSSQPSAAAPTRRGGR